MKKNVIIILVICLVIALGVIVGKNINKNVKPTNSNKVENIAKSENENKNNVVNNEVSNNEKDNTIENSNTTSQNQEQEATEKPKTDLEKAIELVKADWGDDETVYFSDDSEDYGKDGKIEYVICVREKSTTNAKAWYTVDLDKGTFEKEVENEF